MESSNWQTKLSTLRERSEYAFDNSLFTDVEFSVVDCDGNKVIVPSNKYALAVTSPVFAAMFYGQLAEAKPIIDLPDCTKEGLNEMLRYAHTEDANLTGSNVMEVLYLAKKYIMPFLVEKCKKYLENEVGPEDVFSVLPQIQKIGSKDLEKHCWGIVDNETHRAVSSESFLNLSKEMLCEVLTRDTLNINEMHLFQAVDKWATKRIGEKKLVCNGENKRAILGEDVIRLIRFPLMKQKEFVEVVLPCKLLNMDEVTEVFQIFNGVPSVTHVFTEKKRSQIILVSGVRFDRFESTWHYGVEPDALDFTVNKTADIVGVRLLGAQESNYDVKLKLYNNSRSNCISQLTSSYFTENEKIDGLYYGFTVTLDKPVTLVPGDVYTVEATIQGPGSCCGMSGADVVSVGDITITYKYASQPNNGTSTEQGQFPSLVLRLYNVF